MSDKHYYLQHLKEVSRDLRKNGTPAEGRLWTLLKNRQVGGLKFRRQVSVDNYVMDFFCPDLKLCIELDGAVHYHFDSSMRDFERTEYLNIKYGIKILRFENRVVFENPQIIINAILDFASKK